MPDKELETKETETKETQTQSGEGAKPVVVDKSTTAADAQLALDNARLKQELEEIRDKEKERERKELEEKGKFEELAATTRSENEALKKQIALSNRKNEVQQAVTALDTEYDKATLMELANLLDTQKGNEGDVSDLMKMVVEKADKLISHRVTQTMDGGGGSAKKADIEGDMEAEFKKLHKEVMQSGSDVAKFKLRRLRGKLIEMGKKPADIVKGITG